MGKLSQRKGADFERWAANALRTVWPNAKRGLVQRRDASEGADVENTGPFWIECKHQAHPNIDAAVTQAEKASAGTGQWVAAITRKTGGQVLVTMTLDDWLELVGTHEGIDRG